MNAKSKLLGIGLSLLVVTPVLRADASSYVTIVKERDTVLTKIVADVETRFSLGTADEAAVSSAKLALYSFRRDAARTTNEKLKQQEEIVALQEKKLRTIKARAKAGTVDSLDILRATDDVLAAKQLLEEFQALATKG